MAVSGPILGFCQDCDALSGLSRDLRRLGLLWNCWQGLRQLRKGVDVLQKGLHDLECTLKLFGRGSLGFVCGAVAEDSRLVKDTGPARCQMLGSQALDPIAQ